jgi:DNA-binding transcriptional ArsR family regulator
MLEDTAADALAALGNPTRLRLFRMLVKAGPEGATVGQLQAGLKVPGSTLNHHCNALRSAGLVIQRRRGREIICSAQFDHMHDLVNFLTEECCCGLETEPASDREPTEHAA